MNGSEQVWQTKDGRKIPVREMPDLHLDRAIWLIEHQASAERARLLEEGRDKLNYTKDEFGRKVILRALRDLQEQMPRPQDVNPMYYALVAERERRQDDGVSIPEPETESPYEETPWWVN